MAVAMNNNFNVRSVHLVDNFSSEPNIVGTVHLTSSHFVFKADDGGKDIWVVYALIGSVERTGLSIAGSRLIIKCKHFFTLMLQVTRDKDCQNLFETLLRCSKLTNISESFAFAYKNEKGRPPSAGSWQRLDWHEEFERQGLGDSWVESSFNANHVYCDTYPERLWFPRTASLQLLIGSCSFRSKSRLPALTYFYKPNGATICRCAQPLSGFSARCVEDEALMELIMNANPSASPLYLIDTRPRVNAYANKVQGKGFEDARNYINIQFHFFDIENIHVMRNSLAKLLEACQKQQSVTQYLRNVDGSGWLRHVRALVECGKFIADSMLRGVSCVVHCSDGWDRTSQAVSLAQIILDPFYRTIRGFQVLIEKDWLAFGHKFDDRCAHLGTSSDEALREISPIFTQFLDAVYQIMRKRPLAFEFNERFLLDMNEHAYSCVYGTFLGNCDKDRKDLRVVSRTQSLWAYMDSHMDDYMNPFYEDGISFLTDVDLRPSSFIVWTAMYNRFDTGIQPREYWLDLATNAKLHADFLRGLVDNGHALKNQSPGGVSIKWQSILNADECSAEKCKREFNSRFDRRLHCLSCGKIFCHRCFATASSTSTDQEYRLCNGCAALN